MAPEIFVHAEGRGELITLSIVSQVVGAKRHEHLPDAASSLCLPSACSTNCAAVSWRSWPIHCTCMGPVKHMSSVSYSAQSMGTWITRLSIEPESPMMHRQNELDVEC